MKKKSIKTVNKELKKLRGSVIKHRGVKHSRLNVVEKVLESKVKKINRQIQGYPQILKAPAKKLKYDRELAEVEGKLKNLDSQQMPKVKVKRTVSSGVAHSSNQEFKKINSRIKDKPKRLFSIFEKVLSKEERQRAKQEAIREVKLTSKRLKVPTNELAEVEEELSETDN